MADTAAKASNLAGETAPPTDAIVEQWIVDYFPESVITRDSQGWALFQQAAAALKQRLRGVEHE